jgi:hypothetical protein
MELSWGPEMSPVMEGSGYDISLIWGTSEDFYYHSQSSQNMVLPAACNITVGYSCGLRCQMPNVTRQGRMHTLSLPIQRSPDLIKFLLELWTNGMCFKPRGTGTIVFQGSKMAASVIVGAVKGAWEWPPCFPMSWSCQSELWHSS